MPEIGHHGLATGVREIDADTEALSFLMSRIFDPLVECRRGEGNCDHCQCTRIDAVLRYVRRSFARQEDLMASAAYPGETAHRVDHAALVEQLKAMQAARVCADHDRILVREAVNRWLAAHHGGYDRPLANWTVTRRILSPGS
jgi:Hemerythrin